MLYFRINECEIEKYQVNFDKEEIKKLRDIIINNCSYIQHKEYESNHRPSFFDEIIKNYTWTYTGKVKEYFEETRDICRYSYDEYKPPYLVELIDKLLNGNSKAIDEILSYDIAATETIEDRIELKNEEFNKIAPEDILKKKEKLKELEDLLKEKELNKNQQSIEEYYNQLIGLIKFDLIDTVSIIKLHRIESFLEMDLSGQIGISESKENLTSISHKEPAVMLCQPQFIDDTKYSSRETDEFIQAPVLKNSIYPKGK